VVFSGWPSARLKDFSCVGAQSFQHTFKESGALQIFFLAKDGLFT
jgi:hypothetical protein